MTPGRFRGQDLALQWLILVAFRLPNECYAAHGDGLVQTMDWRGVRMSDPGGIAYRTFAGHLTVNNGPVIDKTGLTGTFDVHLRWARDPEPTTTLGPAPSTGPGAPSIFDALEEQLGLKLESGRGPVEYLIVDHVERPSGN